MKSIILLSILVLGTTSAYAQCTADDLNCAQNLDEYLDLESDLHPLTTSKFNKKSLLNLGQLLFQQANISCYYSNEADSLVVLKGDSIVSGFKTDGLLIDSVTYLNGVDVLKIHSSGSVGNAPTNVVWFAEYHYITLLFLRKHLWLTTEIGYSTTTEHYFVLEYLEDEPDDTYTGQIDSSLIDYQLTTSGDTLIFQGHISRSCWSHEWKPDTQVYEDLEVKCATSNIKKYILKEKTLELVP
ncbi:MAG: hypothetical protein H6608_12345 [Flavobacteriales bacterium]|nr:hypothetical protein [Bacteroidota bacterium]MCB9241921.1 hypothetical protein [Flavobacteriales bacterium]